MRLYQWKQTLIRQGLAALAVSGIVIYANPYHANSQETLDFVGIGENGTGIPDTYGDNLAGTPNIDVTWNSADDDTAADGWDSYPSWDGRGEVGQTDFNQQNPITVTFTPEAGFGAVVTSFDLDEFVGGGDSIIAWNLIGTGISGIWDDFSDMVGGNGGRTTIETGMTAADATNEPLVLELELVGTAFGSYLAVDNLTFDQVAIDDCLLGDVNQDGEVDLLDVTPFVELLTGGGYSCEADINGDGSVNLLDVQPFVDILTGG